MDFLVETYGTGFKAEKNLKKSNQDLPRLCFDR